MFMAGAIWEENWWSSGGHGVVWGFMDNGEQDYASSNGISWMIFAELIKIKIKIQI